MSSLNQNVIRHKIGLLNLAVELGNVSKACKVMGLSRDAFYRYQNAVAEGGVDALFDSNRRKPNPKNRVDEATEIAVLAYAIEQPAHGQVRVSNELRRRGIFVSPSGVRSIGLRHELSSFKLRLVALEKQVAEKGIVLSDDQVAALERKQDDDLVHGEIETAHPGYLGSQDTFYVGTIKGVGRIYQQTFAPAAETAANEESRTVSGSESGPAFDGTICQPSSASARGQPVGADFATGTQPA
ncbi:winged helix-turn helix protein, partial [Burkholderia sp. SJZ115]